MYARLADNTLVFLREIRADDKERLADGLANLSEESGEVDGRDHYAVVAVPVDEDEQIVAVARFVRLAGDPRGAAEAAITICDNLQGRGLGALLARRISDAARERGIDKLTATIASENRAALKLMQRIDERLKGAPVGSSVTEVVARLPVADPDELDDDAGTTASVSTAAA